MSAPPRQPAAGFTLVELSIVLVIVAIGATLAVPLMSDGDATALRSAARLFAADLANAQARSLAHGDNPCVIVLDGDHCYYLATQADPAAPITSAVDGQPYRRTFGQGAAASLAGVTIASHQFDGDNRLGFGPFGALDQGDAADLTLTAGSHTLHIQIDPITAEATIGMIE